MKKRFAALKKLGAGIGALAATAPFTMASALPTDGGIGLQPANSATAEEVHFFHNVILMPVMVIISAFVLGLLLWVMVRYNAKSNPTPNKFSHNTLVEIIWTVIPIFILVGIAIPSFDLLYRQDVTPDGRQSVAQADGSSVAFTFDNAFQEESRNVRRAKHLQVLVDNGSGPQLLENKTDYTIEGLGEPEVVVVLNDAPQAGSNVIIRGGRSIDFRGDVTLAPTMTIKVNGFQWGWIYSYPDYGDFEFVSNMMPEDQTTPELYLFEVDNRVVVPVGETIRLAVTARDVLHAWAMPAFSTKIDAVPGRINETWFKADREGVFYGQCSEICGVAHSRMPIAVEVVSRPEFEAWVDSQRALAGMEPMFDANSIKVAQADADASAE